MSIYGTLFLIFLVLKLVGVIQWSWIWVLSPIWFPIILGALKGIIYWLFET